MLDNFPTDEQESCDNLDMVLQKPAEKHVSNEELFYGLSTIFAFFQTKTYFGF